MIPAVPDQPPQAPADPSAPAFEPPRAERLAPAHRLAGAVRLVGPRSPSPLAAGRKFLASAPAHGIDLDLFFGTVEARIGDERPITDWVSQVVLVVPGAGRTGVVFLAEPKAGVAQGLDHARRVACLREATAHARSLGGTIQILQCLPEPTEPWADKALREAGYSFIGHLLYLRRPLQEKSPTEAAVDPSAPWPEGVQVLRMKDLADPDETLKAGLERTYIDTRDCPGLTGLRQTEDVIASHRAPGVYDPALWHVVFLNGQPCGCVLLNRCPELRCFELVYLGLGPEVRGMGLGKRLMELGLRTCRESGGLGGKGGAWDVTCAVDASNAPAMKLYQGLGFRPFQRRMAFVLPMPT